MEGLTDLIRTQSFSREFTCLEVVIMFQCHVTREPRTRHECPHVRCTKNVSGPKKNVPDPRKNVPGPGKKHSTHTDLLEHINYDEKKEVCDVHKNNYSIPVASEQQTSTRGVDFILGLIVFRVNLH